MLAEDKKLTEFLAFQKCIDAMQIEHDKRLCDLVAEASVNVTAASSTEEKIIFNRRVFILQGEFICRDGDIKEALREFINQKLEEGADGYKLVKHVTDDPKCMDFALLL